jgi:AraC-like DNA-binding protein
MPFARRPGKHRLRQALTFGQFAPGTNSESRGDSSQLWEEAVQLECGRLAKRERWRSAGAISVGRFEFDRAVVLRGTTDMALLVIAEPGLRTWGWAMQEDETLSLPEGRKFDLYVPAATSVQFVMGEPVTELVSGLPDQTSELLHRSSSAIRAMLWSEANDGDEAKLRHSMAAALDGRERAVKPEIVADGTRSRAVRGALAFIESRAHVSLRLADLCSATGVGARTIEYGFQAFYDIAPMTYVKYLRLNRARRDLVRAGASAPSVKSHAEVWGFRHMGQFAKDYKVLFGENPSTTLVRSQDRLRA